VNRRSAARRSKSKSDFARTLPWATIAQGLVLTGRRWRSLSEKDRARLRRLARDSQGRVGNLSSKERAELRKLVGKLDLRGLAGELVQLVHRGRGRGRRRAGR
jgi:hypothetical protein